jgi:hypothetical protein
MSGWDDPMGRIRELERELWRLRQQAEAEWFNGNIGEDAYERIVRADQ